MVREVAPDAVPEGALLESDEARAELRGALLRRYLDAGAPVARGDVLRPRDRGFLAAVLRPGSRAIAVGVDAVTGAAGLIWPGDQVDLILTQEIDAAAAPVARRVVGETVLTDVRVIAVDQQFTQGRRPGWPPAATPAQRGAHRHARGHAGAGGAGRRRGAPGQALPVGPRHGAGGRRRAVRRPRPPPSSARDVSPALFAHRTCRRITDAGHSGRRSAGGHVPVNQGHSPLRASPRRWSPARHRPGARRRPAPPRAAPAARRPDHPDARHRAGAGARSRIARPRPLPVAAGSRQRPPARTCPARHPPCSPPTRGWRGSSRPRRPALPHGRRRRAHHRDRHRRGRRADRRIRRHRAGAAPKRPSRPAAGRARRRRGAAQRPGLPRRRSRRLSGRWPAAPGAVQCAPSRAASC